MVDVAKLQEPPAEKMEERKDFHQEKNFSLEGGRVSQSQREIIGYRRRIAVGHGELRRAIQRVTISALGKTERY
jgi:hypothetical protein